MRFVCTCVHFCTFVQKQANADLKKPFIIFDETKQKPAAQFIPIGRDLAAAVQAVKQFLDTVPFSILPKNLRERVNKTLNRVDFQDVIPDVSAVPHAVRMHASMYACMKHRLIVCSVACALLCSGRRSCSAMFSPTSTTSQSATSPS